MSIWNYDAIALSLGGGTVILIVKRRSRDFKGGSAKLFIDLVLLCSREGALVKKKIA